jgi:hypothetical protein
MLFQYIFGYKKKILILNWNAYTHIELIKSIFYQEITELRYLTLQYESCT